MTDSKIIRVDTLEHCPFRHAGFCVAFGVSNLIPPPRCSAVECYSVPAGCPLRTTPITVAFDPSEADNA